MTSPSGGPLNWFDSYLSSRKFFVSMNDIFLGVGILNCGVTQKSILEKLLFLIHIINDLSNRYQNVALTFTLMCIFYQDKDTHKTEDVITTELSKLKWFVDTKLSIHFGEDKTKCILFSKTKR